MQREWNTGQPRLRLVVDREVENRYFGCSRAFHRYLCRIKMNSISLRRNLDNRVAEIVVAAGRYQSNPCAVLRSQIVQIVPKLRVSQLARPNLPSQRSRQSQNHDPKNEPLAS